MIELIFENPGCLQGKRWHDIGNKFKILPKFLETIGKRVQEINWLFPFRYLILAKKRKI